MSPTSHRVSFMFIFLGTALTFGAEPPVAASRPATTTRATAPAASRPAIGELKGLMAQLDADEWAIREAAEEKIAMLGEAARADLERQLKATPDGEVGRRIGVLLAKLDEARLNGPTRVTLHLRDVPAREALTALAAQANISFVPAPETLWAAGSEPRVSLVCDDEPFWSAVQQLCAAAKLQMMRSDPHAPVQLALADSKPAAPYAVAGPFLLKIKRIDHTRSAEFDGPNDNNASPGCRISLFVWGEPKMAAGVWSIEQVDEMLTDKGQQPIDRRNFYGRGTQVGSTNEGAMTFRGEVAGSRITRLRMTLQVNVVGKTASFEVANVLAARKVQRTIGGYAFELRDVNRIVEGRYAYTVEVTRGEHTPAEFNAFRQTLSRSQPRLLDAQGRPLSFSGGSAQFGPDKYTLTNQLTNDRAGAAKVGEPAKFTWDIPVETRTMSFPVELKELPLP
jgi:hypothetical protein